MAEIVPVSIHTDKKSYVVTLEGTTRTEADMRVGRLRPGIVYDNDTTSVFTFGGAEEGGAFMKTAIRYRYSRPDNFLAGCNSSGAWESMSDMAQPRASFNPCIYGGYIYIAGGGHPTIEVYDPASLQIKPLYRDQYVDPDISIMVAHMDNLVMFGGTKVFRLSYSTGRVVEERERMAGPGWSNVTPVVAEKAVYTVIMTNRGFSLFKLGAFTGKALSERKFE